MIASNTRSVSALACCCLSTARLGLPVRLVSGQKAECSSNCMPLGRALNGFIATPIRAKPWYESIET